jgi:hypothetical protein
MSTLGLSSRPHTHTGKPAPLEAHAVFAPEEVAWLAVEAAARLAANGGKSGPLRLGDRSSLARLAEDRRLAALASILARMPQRAAAARVGRAGMLPRLGDLELLIEIGGPTSLPGIVRTRADAAGDAIVLAVTFAPDMASAPSPEGATDAVDGLWPPAAVVAG